MKIAVSFKNHKNEAKRGIDFYTDKIVEGIKSREKIELVKEDAADLIHLTSADFFNNPRFDLLNKKYIYTIHDLIPIKFSEHFPKGIKGSTKWMFNRIIMKKAKFMITDSVSSKNDIVKIIKYPEEKITVIPLAPRENFKLMTKEEKEKFSSVKEKYNIADDFVLYVGDVNWNKNLPGLAKACIELEYPLVVVGSKADKEKFNSKHPENKPLKEFKQIQKKNPELIITTGFIPERYLVYIYNIARLYCQPSYYEGFGLPVLEAMACGCPVLSSNQGSLPEVGNKAAVYFNPYYKEEIKRKLKKFWKLKDNQVKYQELSKNCLQNADQYSWEQTLEKTFNVYRKALNEN